MNDSSIGTKTCDGIKTKTHVVLLFTASNENMKLNSCNSIESTLYININLELSVDILLIVNIIRCDI